MAAIKGTSNIISAFHNLKKAIDHFRVFTLEHKDSKGAKLFTHYISRINWLYNDIVTHPAFSEAIREGIRQEWASDAFAVDAIAEKAALLNPEQREGLEYIIEQMLKGETIKVEHIKEEVIHE